MLTSPDASPASCRVAPDIAIDISEGNEPSSGDKTKVDEQTRTHAIKLFVYNTQNTTPDITALIAAARRNGVAVTTVSETLTPVSAVVEPP